MESGPSPEGRTATRIELDNGFCFSIAEASLPISIGRDSSCDIRIPSGHVSRHHCEIFLQNGVLCLRDTSSNGTKVDNRLVRQSSVSISQRTSVLLADEVKMILTPVSGDKTILGAPAARARQASPESQDIVADADADRRDRDRRDREERRKRSIVVSFDRRSDGSDRRSGDRRDPE